MSNETPHRAAAPHDEEEHEEHEEGEPWLVSYADMMTLLFGFFVLMYTFAIAKVDKESNEFVKVRKEVAAYFSGTSTEESEEEKEGRTSSMLDPSLYRPLLNLLGSSSGTRRDGKGAGADPTKVFEQKREELRARALRNEAKILESVADDLSKAPMGVEKLPHDGGSVEADNEYILTFSSDRLFAVSVDPSALSLSAESDKILDKLVDATARIGRPMRFAVESYMDPRLRKGPPTLADRRDAFEATGKRSAVVLEALLRKLGDKGDKHVFAASGYGFLDPSRLDSRVTRDRVLVRVSLLPDK